MSHILVKKHASLISMSFLAFLKTAMRSPWIYSV